MTDKPKPSDKEEQKPANAEPRLNLIRYTGTANRRILTMANMAALGAPVEQDLVWDRSNKKSINTKDLNSNAVEAISKLAGFETV